MKARTLADLKALKRALDAEQAQARARETEAQAQAARERQRQEAAQRLFATAVGPVVPLAAQGRRLLRPPPAPPLAQQRVLDEKEVMQEALSDEFDAETLLFTDEQLSFRRPGLGPDVVRKLRRGGWALQGEIDLHGLRTGEAREALAGFLRHAHTQGWRCVRVVHGKGLGSPGKTPVLKSRVQSWLMQKNEVLAFVQARPVEGGAGALVVLLQPSAARSTT